MPGGIGTFEAATIFLLARLGVPIEEALAATLLCRAFTFWGPMPPGILLARREWPRASRRGRDVLSQRHA
jgi:glycosyltransferase 2 family protein